QPLGRPAVGDISTAGQPRRLGHGQRQHSGAGGHGTGERTDQGVRRARRRHEAVRPRHGRVRGPGGGRRRRRHLHPRRRRDPVQRHHRAE
ncbi:hypothetical protein BN1708_020501, partial [Verticillium longisporum]